MAWQVLKRTPLLSTSQIHLGEVARSQGVKPGSATALPHSDASVDAIYSSHMLEHLDRESARAFLDEAHRVLRSGGVLRVAVPDLGRLVERYNTDGDADGFVAATLLGSETSITALDRLRHLVLGSRAHAWMYDERSLISLVEAAGFEEVRSLPPGQTGIAAPGSLDLWERADESVYVEAVKR